MFPARPEIDWHHMFPARPERAEAPSPGQRPGYDIEMVITPCKGKSFPTAAIYFNAFALTGRRATTTITQGDALG